MTSSISIVSLGWIAFCILALHSPTSHGLNEEGHMKKKFIMAWCLNTQKYFFQLIKPNDQDRYSGCYWLLSSLCQHPCQKLAVSHRFSIPGLMWHVFYEPLTYIKPTKYCFSIISRLRHLLSKYAYTQVSGSWLNEINSSWKFQVDVPFVCRIEKRLPRFEKKCICTISRGLYFCR